MLARPGSIHASLSKGIKAIAQVMWLTCTCTYADGLIYVDRCFRKDYSAAVLVRTDFLKKVLGFQKINDTLYNLEWGDDDHQNLRLLLRVLQRWQLLPREYSGSACPL